MYKILITRSVMGNFFWTLMNSNGKRMAESNMITEKRSVDRVIKPLAKKLGASIDFLDLEKDCEQ